MGGFYREHARSSVGTHLPSPKPRVFAGRLRRTLLRRINGERSPGDSFPLSPTPVPFKKLGGKPLFFSLSCVFSSRFFFSRSLFFRPPLFFFLPKKKKKKKKK